MHFNCLHTYIRIHYIIVMAIICACVQYFFPANCKYRCSVRPCISNLPASVITVFTRHSIPCAKVLRCLLGFIFGTPIRATVAPTKTESLARLFCMNHFTVLHYCCLCVVCIRAYIHIYNRFLHPISSPVYVHSSTYTHTYICLSLCTLSMTRVRVQCRM